MEPKLYPLIFEPVFEKRAENTLETAPWFLDFIKSVNLPVPDKEAIDHCWLLADSPMIQTHVGNGVLAGEPLRRLMETRSRELVGPHHPSDRPFPLCVNIFATNEDQPLLVHADNDAPRELREGHANMKLWYSLAVQPDSCAFIGIHPSASAQQLLGQLHTREAQRFLQKFKIKPGDSCLIPPGIVHSLSRGHLIWEVKTGIAPPLRLGSWQTSHSTPLEEQEAARQCIKMESRQSARAARVRGPLTHTRKIPLTRHWPYFSAEEIRVADHIFLDTNGESCHLLYLITGDLTLQYSGQEEISLPPGRLCCVPASLGQYKLITTRQAEVLRTGHRS